MLTLIIQLFFFFCKKRVVRIFIEGGLDKSSTWKVDFFFLSFIYRICFFIYFHEQTIQIPTPCTADFCCDLLRMKPTIRSITEDSFRLVEVHGVTGV